MKDTIEERALELRRVLYPDTVPLLAIVKMTWDRLDDDDKTTLHLAATWPPDFKVAPSIREKVLPLTDGEGRMERSVAESVDILAGRWHREAGRI